VSGGTLQFTLQNSALAVQRTRTRGYWRVAGKDNPLLEWAVTHCYRRMWEGLDLAMSYPTIHPEREANHDKTNKQLGKRVPMKKK
jgi:hypothetical protein